MKKEKYIQIFNYLLKFSELRSNTVRDIEKSETQYPEKIWFSDIPKYEIFDCITFPDYNQEADYWIKLIKPKSEPVPPSFPRISDNIKDWIVEDTLTREDGLPVLKESINKNGILIFLKDNPQIETDYKAYIDNKWYSDLCIFKKEEQSYLPKKAIYDSQINTYKKLFSIYNKAQQFGEEYELVVGVGLLNFKEDLNSPLLCRHIMTSKAEIKFEFSARESFIKVLPSIENEIQIETDAIIDLEKQFDSADIIEAEKSVIDFLKVKNITDNPFDDQIIDAIRIFAARMRLDGLAYENLTKPNEIPKKPSLYFAPALILRKRNTRSFTALYYKIIDQISSADDSINIDSINDIIGEYEERRVFEDSPEKGHFELQKTDIIFFPKKYNDEQIEIIEKAQKNNKVLVQGPPGTGKSHTIANLICHLLANGKKVLVTAYTKRALEVLKNQLPEDYRGLTVNLLSGDSASIQDLESSVNAINDKLSGVSSISNYRKEITEKEGELTLLKAEKASTKNEWLKIKEKSIRSQILNDNYKGILIEIAEQIEKDHAKYSWFKDDFCDIEVLGLQSEIERFHSLTILYNEIDCNQFKFDVPQKEMLLSQVELKIYGNIVNKLISYHSSKENHIEIKSKDYSVLIDGLKDLKKLFDKIESYELPHKAQIIQEYPTKIGIWKEKLSSTQSILTELPENQIKEYDRSIEIEYPKDKSLIQLKNDAQKLLSYMKEGNELSGVKFALKKALLHKEIKEKLYFIQSVKVNGSPCDTIDEFQTVLFDIKVKQDFAELESMWGFIENGKLLKCFDRLNYFVKLQEDYSDLVELIVESNQLKSKIESQSSITIKNYDCNNLQELIEEAEYNFLIARERLINEKIDKADKHLSLYNMHPISNEIRNAIKLIDLDEYERLLALIENLQKDKEKYLSYIDIKENLKKFVPVLITEITENTFDQLNINKINNAIKYKHALSEITKLLSEDYESHLTIKMSELDSKEDKLISTIGSQKAWLHVLEGLDNNFLLRQNLQAWVQAVKKIGKTGTGKRALKFRKEAQQQMDKCKDTVPCWIMPLYKVVETITPQKGMYDYVIIDEASQLGADAIFLLYISKNIIIVGDDKQTSPEYVGVDANQMNPYINRYLKDIPFANYYGTEFSFFDHAKRFCNGMTVLREHFRCMPEIIEFCNKHFYAPDGKGLYPLKQYSENRIEPLKTYYCKDGYIDGSYQNITNRIEAEAIANKMAELITNETYKGKSFGVIGLQGNKQSAIIENAIIKKIGDVQYKQRNIVCGTSASFQGDERDVMFLSLVTANNHNRMALVKPEDERRFNVAVSRAKEQIWLFHSIQLEDLSNSNDLRYKLLDHFLNYKPQQVPIPRKFERTIGSQPDPFESWFEVDIYNDIVERKYKVIPQYEVAKGKYRIDLVSILANGVKIAIECDGDKYHGPEQFHNDLLRQKNLERCGWQFFRVRGSEYYSNREKTLEPLWKLLIDNDKNFIDNNESRSLTTEDYDNQVQSNNLQEIEESEDLSINLLQQNPNNKEPNKNSIITELKQEPITIELGEYYNSKEILVFTTFSNVYKVQQKETSIPDDIFDQIDFEVGEEAIYMTGVKDYSGFLIVAFENGKIGKVSMNSFYTEHNRKKLKNSYNTEAKLIYIEHIGGDIDLVTISNIKKVVVFNTRLINPVDSRNTKGVQVMKQKYGSIMTKVCRVEKTRLAEPEYYRKDEGLNVVGYFLKNGDEV